MSEGIITRRIKTPKPLLLDSFPNSAAAYSLRSLTLSGQDNPVVKVRRDSDNAEQDFSSAEINDGSLLTFVGNTASDNGFVTTWYDQSGNSNDATQATAGSQPKIVSGGSLVTENGKPAIDFDGLDDFLATSSFGGLLTQDNFFITSVAKYISNDLEDIGWRIASAPGDPRLSLFVYAASDFRFEDSTSDFEVSDISGLESQSLSSIVYEPNGTSAYYVNGNSEGTVDTSTIIKGENFGNFLYLGARFGGDYNTESVFNEFIIYDSDRSSTRQQIESNINNHYGIY